MENKHEKKTNGQFIQSKVNIHKEIKTKTTGVTTALRRFKKLDEEWQAMQQRPFCGTPKTIATTALSTSQTYTDTVEQMDTGVEGDSESVTNDISQRSTKRKQRSSPEVIDKQKEGRQRNCVL
ncbi:hypothetical protein J6590_106450 [Homalodisca vitripennis]|nr:hypothetical protein J6590_106450 [Homalodisca vitripennis]